jgi:FAD/FMN-containing dehydrogenase/Fe-S oxidoreductase
MTTLSPADMRGVAAASRDLDAALRSRVAGEVRFDGWSRSLYSTDASLYQIQPVGVVIPRHSDDLHAALEVAAVHNVPLLARGAGSSLAGQAVGAALVLDASKYLNRILAIDVEARTAVVEPGVTVAVLNRALAPLGLMLGPDPASAERATIGGSVANNATGSHSILYGMLADHVYAADVLLADGSTAHFGPVAPADLPAYATRAGLEGTIYRDLAALAVDATPAIIAHWPKHWRRASGFGLDRLAAALAPATARIQFDGASRFRPAICNPQRFDTVNLAQFLAGSEGTLAIFKTITLHLVPRPTRTAVAVLHFDDIVAACAAVGDVLEMEPSACELLDKQLMDLARRQPEWARRLHFVAGDPAAVLLTEFYGESEAALEAQLQRLAHHMAQRGHRGVVVHVTEPQRQADLWAVRKAGLNLLMSRRGDFKPVPGIEDVSVPPEQLAAYIARVRTWCGARPGVRDLAVYAHASAGCLHVRPVVNVKTAQGVATLQAMADFATGLCLEYGGALSGEHGDGISRSALNERLFGPQLYAALQRVKRIFDANNLLNPGKVVNGPPLTENLRMGAGYATIPIKTIFDWSSDGGFAPAIEMCNGAAVCRKTETGIMCPSYMATRDEMDTTRGRANALRNALAGRIPHEELFSDGMAEVMDLCLGCKACKSECPSSVDMARIKAEFLVHYYRAHGLPLFNRLMGRLPQMNELLYQAAPPLTPLLVSALNGVLQSRLFRHIVQPALGVAAERTLPLYAPRTFAQEAADLLAPHSGHSTLDTRHPTPRLILFHDTWTNFNEPGVGMAALRVLRAAGWHVEIAHGRACCGRPLLTGGQADRARPWVDHNVALLAPAAAAGIPIVGLEPSCILTLRDEYPALASDRHRAEILASQAFTFEEFVQRAQAASNFSPTWQSTPAKALLHGHCHTRALVGNAPAHAALEAAGYNVEVLPTGCCGMAGDFGYERDHYDVSRTIGEERLLPAVRAAAVDVVIVASGTSCRHQIADLSGRKAFHLTEALALRLA